MVHLRASFVVLILVGLLTGCSFGPLSQQAHKMGEVVTVGPIVYNVYETDWRQQLGSDLGSVAAKEKFLLVSLTITNSGNQQVAVPLLTLQDISGKEYLEVRDVKGVANWLGLLRVMEPASTIQGAIVFDVPSADYKLIVTDGGDLESEKTAIIDIPLMLASPGNVEPPPAGTGP